MKMHIIVKKNMILTRILWKYNDWSMDDTIYEITDGCELEIMS